jgi:hypothetical protein
MSPTPPLRTAKRFLGLAIAIFLQIVLFLAIFPATRPYALILVIMVVKIVLSMTILVLLLARINKIAACVLYFFIAILLLIAESFFFLKTNWISRQRQEMSIILSLFFPWIMFIVNTLLQSITTQPVGEAGQQNTSQEPERLRNRNGV